MPTYTHLVGLTRSSGFFCSFTQRRDSAAVPALYGKPGAGCSSFFLLVRAASDAESSSAGCSICWHEFAFQKV